MIKAGIIQTRQYRSNAEAMTEASRIMLKLAKNETDIVCLPEQWLNDNTVLDFDAQFSDFTKISKDYSMIIVPGAFYEKNGDNYRITAPLIEDGEIIGKQEKIHPFDYERFKIKPGTEARVFKTRKASIGIIICYDMVFAGVAETMVKKGADILLSPSRIIKRGIKPWHIYVQARSLENRVPILAANVSNKKFGGQSIIADLKEKDQIMIPKLDVLGRSQASITASFKISNYKKSRSHRYMDKMHFS
ncbi:MAG TPA: carbon-nitrogen hydrolase family protein [Candidatus Nitrosotenuis sp.]|nr:carbon-nitrogen hydrolase family protein [Candidatus Nitrosotenuis sp.]